MTLPLLLGAAPLSPLVLDLVVILAAAAIVAMIGQRLRLALIPAYLITGVLIAPVIRLIGDPSAINSIASMALIFLLFGIGLHLDLSAFRGALGPMVAVGLGSTVLSVGLGWPLVMLFGLPADSALVVAMAMSMSSTAVVLRILQERRELRHASARLSTAVLIIQDLLVVVMLALIGPLAGLRGGAPAAETAGRGVEGYLVQGVIAVAGVALLLLIGRFILPRLLAEAARQRSTELMLVLAAAVAIGAAAVTSTVGFSAELGAFIAGFVLAATPFRYQIAGQLASLRDLFMVVFFTTVGLTIDTHQLLHAWWIVPLGLVAVLAGKAVVMFVCAWAAGTTSRVAVSNAAALAQAGEFSLVVLTAGFHAGLVSPAANAAAVAIVVLSLMITPLLLVRGRALAAKMPSLPTPPWIRHVTLAEGGATGPDEASSAGRPGVIIAGFGPVGRAAADRLQRSGIPYIVIELNPETVRRQKAMGRRIVYGDATNPEVLLSAGAYEADAVILTMPDDDAMIRACKSVRTLSPDTFIAARATYLSKAMTARANGADEVIVEEVAAAEAMVRMVEAEIERRTHGTTAGAPEPSHPDPLPEGPNR